MIFLYTFVCLILALGGRQARVHFDFVERRVDPETVYSSAINLNPLNATEAALTLFHVYSLAEDLQAKERSAKKTADHTLTTSGSAVTDIIEIGKLYCNAQPLDQHVKEYAGIINNAKSKSLAVAPDLMKVVISLHDLAYKISMKTTLQMRNFDRLSEQCPATLGEKCILDKINKFVIFYNDEVKVFPTYKNDANEIYQKGLALLNEWNLNVVLPSARNISEKAKEFVENYFTKCNISSQQIIEHYLLVAKNYYNIFQSRIPTNITAIKELVATISNKNYQYAGDIRASVITAVQPLDSATATILNSKNPSVITEEIKLALANMIADSVKEFNSHTTKYSAQALDSELEATKVVQLYEERYSKYTYNSLLNDCFNASSQYALADMNECSNAELNKTIYVNYNKDVVDKLLDIRNSLELIDANYRSNFAQKAAELTTAVTDSANHLAYKLYKAAGLRVPQNLVKYQCIFPIILPATDETVCIAVVEHLRIK